MIRLFKLNKRELYLLILCCILIVSVISYITIIEPFLKHYKSIKEEIQDKKVRLVKFKRTLLRKDFTEHTYQDILPRLTQEGSDEEKFTHFLKEVEVTSRRSDIYITTLKPINIIEGESEKEYLIRVEAEGKLNSLAEFLFNLAESEQLISLKRLQVSYVLRQKDLLQIQMSLGRVLLNEESKN